MYRFHICTPEENRWTTIEFCFKIHWVPHQHNATDRRNVRERDDLHSKHTTEAKHGKQLREYIHIETITHWHEPSYHRTYIIRFMLNKKLSSDGKNSHYKDTRERNNNGICFFLCCWFHFALAVRQSTKQKILEIFWLITDTAPNDIVQAHKPYLEMVLLNSLEFLKFWIRNDLCEVDHT